MVSDAQLRALVATAHARRHQGGCLAWRGESFRRAAATGRSLLQPQTRAAVVGNLVAMVERYELDGLDIDLEGDLMMGIDAAGNYTPFVRALAEALHARSKVLTAATGSYRGRHGSRCVAGVFRPDRNHGL